jgi:uncharacterized membrane protein YhaH (DUF805 family)
MADLITEGAWLIPSTLLLFGIVVLCIVSRKARLIVACVLVVVGVMVDLMGLRHCDCDNGYGPPPWRRRW